MAPRKPAHVVMGSTDQAVTQRFFTDGIGFKVSDVVPSLAAFMRCSTDHHNVLVQQAPVNFLHHISWQVEDIDEIGRSGAPPYQPGQRTRRHPADALDTAVLLARSPPSPLAQFVGIAADRKAFRERA